MKVSELIKLLENKPADADVIFPDGDYKDSHSPVTSVTYVKEATWGKQGNVVVLSNERGSV